jgi:hypothetical protein
MPQNWWEKFPQVMPSPAAGPYPLPAPGGVVPGPGPGMGLGSDPLYGAPLLGQDPVGPFDPSYFSGGPAGAGQFPGSSADQAMSFGYPQPPLAGDQAGTLSDRKLAVQQAAAAIQGGADPRAVRARLNQLGTGRPDIDPLDPFSDLLPGGQQGSGNPPQGPQPDALSSGQPPFARDSMLGGYDSSGITGSAVAQMATSPDPSNFQPPQRLIGPGGGGLDRTSSFAGLQSGLDPGSYAAAYAQNPSGTLPANQLGIGFNGTGYSPAGSVSDIQAQPGDDFVNHMRAVVDSLPPDPAGRDQPLPPEHPLSGPPAHFGSDEAIVVTRPRLADRHPPGQRAAHQLGSLSMTFETGGRGPRTISPGRNDPGGPSYGSYQLATNYGQPQNFLRNEGRRWLPEFHGAAPGTPAFDRVWQAIADREPRAFAQAQHAYIDRTHYSPVVQTVLRRTGLDLNSRSDAVRDATWSSSVQHDTAPKLLTSAVRATDRLVPDRRSPHYDEVLINNIYDVRSAKVRSLAAHARTAGRRQMYLNILANRYPQERREALRRLRESAQGNR